MPLMGGKIDSLLAEVSRAIVLSSWYKCTCHSKRFEIVELLHFWGSFNVLRLKLDKNYAVNSNTIILLSCALFRPYPLLSGEWSNSGFTVIYSVGYWNEPSNREKVFTLKCIMKYVTHYSVQCLSPACTDIPWTFRVPTRWWRSRCCPIGCAMQTVPWIPSSTISWAVSTLWDWTLRYHYVWNPTCFWCFPEKYCVSHCCIAFVGV
jgi:hypothetical protein